MVRVRNIEIVATVALVGSLAACSSAKSDIAAPAGGTASASAASAGTAATAGAPAASASTTAAPAAQTVAALLAAWGQPGKISTKSMPKADPSWTARIQHTAENGTDPRLGPDQLNLIALVDEAAREHDIPSLIRLSNGGETAQALSRPGLLDGLVTLLEQTHPIGQNGFTYPGFELTGGAGTPGADSAVEKADAAALGVSSPVGYKGVHAYFDGHWSGAGADGSLEWVSVNIG